MSKSQKIFTLLEDDMLRKSVMVFHSLIQGAIKHLYSFTYTIKPVKQKEVTYTHI